MYSGYVPGIGFGVSSNSNSGGGGNDGNDGVDGKTVRNGTGAPSDGLGVDGDFYINTTANTIYGPKTGGSWGSPTSLVGSPGNDGVDGQDAIKNLVTAVVDFGFASGGESGYTSVSVAASWVTTNTRLLCQISEDSTTNHDPSDGILEGITAFASDIVPGVGFTLHARALNGTFGQYKINCFGVEI